MKMMWKKDQPDYTTIAWAVLAGAGAGLAVGLLMAPKSGQALRADIGSAVDDYVESARQRASNLKSSANDLANRGLREVRRATDNVAEKAHNIVDKGAKEALQAIDDATAAADHAARKTGEAAGEAASMARAAVRA